jgi:BRCT domain type II-containing protein
VNKSSNVKKKAAVITSNKASIPFYFQSATEKEKTSLEAIAIDNTANTMKISTYVNGPPGYLNGLKIAVSGLMDIGREKMECILIQYGAKVSSYSIRLDTNNCPFFIMSL